MTFADIFCDKLIERFTTLRQEERLSPLSLVSRRFRLGPHAADLLALIPELLGDLLFGRGNARSVVSMAYALSQGALRERSGVLLCHALSPYSESVGLFADIGRGFRLALGLDLDLRVMLASTGWTEFNWVVVDLNLKENLPPNQRWRQKLYKHLDIVPDLCTIENAPDLKDPDTIRQMASEYVRMAKAIWGAEATTGRIIPKDTSAYLGNISICTTKDPGTNLLSIESFKQRLGPQVTALTSVLKNFERLDLGTFTYFFLQYFHQKRYRGCIKASIGRERDFDEPFRLIDSPSDQALESDVLDPRDLMAVYFADYQYGKIESNGKVEVLTAHPYYFPSGSLYRLYRHDVTKAMESCIMLEDDQPKIARLLNGIDDFARARLVSDFLSFAHLFGSKQSEVRKIVARWFKKVDPTGQMSESWDEYAGDRSRGVFANRCREWGQQVFTSFGSEVPLPYHFLPFVWNVATEDVARLMADILAAVRGAFGSPDIVVQPKPM